MINTVNKEYKIFLWFILILFSQITQAEVENTLKIEQLEAAVLKNDILKIKLKNMTQEAEFQLQTQPIIKKTTLLKIKNNLDKQQQEAEMLALKHALEKTKLKLQLQSEQLKAESKVNAIKLKQLKDKLAYREEEEKWKAHTNKSIVYHDRVFDGDTLIVSDRRIALKGPIIYGTAEYITNRIHYLNNVSTQFPIFIVIDYSPGGSVMEGYRILKAMQASKAPVYVVVKSFAASMAAVIATMADKSFAYKNAILLHHQPWGGNRGNLTQQQENIDIFQEWAKRLHTPVAKKMGVTLKQFYFKMYEKNSKGDWQEFADEAVKIKWVDTVVNVIQEQGIVKKPNIIPNQLKAYYNQIVNQDVTVTIPNELNNKLPALRAFDLYFLYNRNNYYQW